MCGILVNISKEKLPPDHPALEVVKHRGPDDYGMESFELPDGRYLSLGHRRLSIIDLSSKGHQPMSRANGALWIVFNGEVYNYLEIRRELEKEGMMFASGTDTEVVLAAYEKWGEKCLEKFNGMFAFAIFDKRSMSLFVARDRFGIKPTYYCNSSKGFALVSEIKQAAELAYSPKQADSEQLYYYLNFGDFTFSNRTMWKDVFEFECGRKLTLDLRTWRPGNPLDITQWYSLPSSADTLDISFDEAGREFRKLLDSAVELRLRADVNVGFLLSGGLDSSTLVGIAHKNPRYQNNKLRTYSSCYDNSPIDEREYIKAVIDFTGADSRLHFPSPADFERAVDKVIWHSDLPIKMGSIVPHWLIYQYIKNERDNRKVILEGQGADEILCGYGDFRWSALNEKAKLASAGRFLLDLISFYKRYPQHPKYFVRKFIRMRHPGLVNYPPNPALDTKNLLQDNTPPPIPIWREAPTVMDLHKNRMIILRYILHNVDRNSMAHSRETRVPFLDHNLVEFCLKLPPEHKMKGGVSKRVLRNSTSDVLPEKVKNRVDKQGYSSPLTEWARNELVEFFRSTLEKAAERPFVNKKHAIDTFDKFVSKGHYFDPVLWRIIAVDHWMDLFGIN